MKVSAERQEYFRSVCDEVMNNIRPEQGVGTLQEKTIHAVLKHLYEPDTGKHEQRVEGYIADIFTGNEIIEIQTRGFYKLRQKLEAFLPVYPVTVVYPVTRHKWLCWVDAGTGEITKPRKSPKVGTVHSLFPELYRLKMFLPNDNLKFKVVLLDVEEYRLLNGWSRDRKKGSTRSDGIPVALQEEITFENIEDYKKLIPDGLPESFTSGEYKTAAGCSKALAGVELNLLAHLGAVQKTGKKGNSILYKKV